MATKPDDPSTAAGGGEASGTNNVDAVDAVDSCPRWLRKVQAFAIKHLLPVSLIIGVVIGAVWPVPGVAVGSKYNGVSPTAYICVIIIFLLQGLKLDTEKIKDAISEYKGFLWGVFSILFVTVCIGAKSTQEIDIPDVPEFTTGMVVFFAMPMTVSSGIVITGQANGNEALAVLLTVTTNVACVFTVPPMLDWLVDFGCDESTDATAALGNGSVLGAHIEDDGCKNIRLDVGKIMLKLALTVLIPVFVGKMVRTNSARVRAFVKRYKYALKLISIYALVALPWMKTSKAKDDGKFDDVTFRAIVSVIGWALFMHLIFLVLNFTVSKLIGIELPEHKAITICASQKTLPVSVTVIGFLPDSAGDKGLMTIACIISHLSQIVIDSYLIGVLPGWNPPEDTTKDVAVAEKGEVLGTKERVGPAAGVERIAMTSQLAM